MYEDTAMTGPQVLVAEDEGLLRNLIAEALTELGLHVMQAADGIQALKILKEHVGISVLLSDIRMPRMGGYDLVEVALAHDPELKILMMTGDAGDQPPPAALKAREIKTLFKPFSMDEMCNKVFGMLGRA